MPWVQGESNLSDSMTKKGARTQVQRYMETQTWTVVYDPKQLSAKKRRAAGMDPLAADDEEWMTGARESVQTKWPNMLDADEEGDRWDADFPRNV